LIEQALYFAIGFLVASLAGVVWTPIISRRATRLAEARAKLLAPISERQAIAERDALRAEHAVERVRLERRVDLAEEAAVGHRAEIGRQLVKIAILEADAAQHRSFDFDRRAEIGELTSECRALEAGLGASQIAIHDLMAQRDRAAAAEAAAISLQNELEAEANRSRASATIRAARAESAEGRYDDLSRSVKTAAERADAVRAQLTDSLAAMSAKAARLEEQLRETIARNHSLLESVSRGDARHEQNQQQLADLGSRLAVSERIREETLVENGRQLGALADREAALRAARARTVELEARLTKATAEPQASEDGAAVKAQTLVSSRVAIEESLEAARDREALQRENDALTTKIASPTSPALHVAGDAALRESIERLGREVNRIYSAQKSASREDFGPNGRFPFGGAEPALEVEPSNDGRPAFAEGPARRVAQSRAPER
jgi:hypothetical protein